MPGHRSHHSLLSEEERKCSVGGGECCCGCDRAAPAVLAATWHHHALPRSLARRGLARASLPSPDRAFPLLLSALVAAVLLMGGSPALAGPTPGAPADALSEEALYAQRDVLRAQLEALEADARRDLDKRLHRMAYEKYREMDATLERDAAVLGELKRREGSLSVRIRIDRELDAVRARQAEVRRMADLLRLVAVR